MQSRVSLIMTQTDMQVYMEGKHKTVLSSTFSGAFFYGRHNNLNLFICLFPLFLWCVIFKTLLSRHGNPQHSFASVKYNR